jgi:hypothetical protein
MISTNVTYEQAAGFDFSTIYRGYPMTLTVAQEKDRFAVTTGGKLLGHIKLGNDRHSWFVADSNYVEYELVKEIGHKIIEKFYF